MAYIYLTLAIVAEVVATSALKASAEFTKIVPSALKASAEFTKIVPSAIVVVGYGLAFYLLALVLRTLPVGVTYAIWSGMGIVLVTIVSMFLYKQTPDLPAIIGMATIILGVVIINLFSKTVNH